MDLRGLMYEWKHALSSDNTSGSRGFFLAVVIGFGIALLLTLVALVCAAIGVVTGSLRTLCFVAFPVILILAIIVFVWISKQE